MSLLKLSIHNFRCIESAGLELDGRCNLVVGPNGSGKTSLLEAVGFLSRGRSFRGTRTDGLVRHGERVFQISAGVRVAEVGHRIGLEAGRGHWHLRVDRQDAESIAALAEKLAVQVVDPEIHRLVADGPEVRRRFIDYGVFHVEQRFLDAWRRYRRALRQRNAALKQRLRGSALSAWDQELIEAGTAVDGWRRSHVEALTAAFETLALSLLGQPATCEYRSGWGESGSLAEALAESLERDREQGTTTVGPHRADLRLVYRGRSARQQVSRGQEKLYAAALVLAQTRLLRRELPEPPVLLVDDPAAELDQGGLERLVGNVLETDCQLLVTALTEAALSLPAGRRVFHVEHGHFRVTGER